jgi:hypothetical protein
MCGSTQEGTANHHLGHSYVFSSCVVLAMREDRMAKDDFLEAERGSSRLARESGLLARALERMDELCNACMPRVSLLLYYVVCY